MFLIGRDRVQSLKKIIKKIMKKPGAEDLKKVWQLELSYPLQAILLMTLNIECLIFITILAERNAQQNQLPVIFIFSIFFHYKGMVLPLFVRPCIYLHF